MEFRLLGSLVERKIGYGIPKEIVGSTEKKFDSTVQE